MHEPALLDRLRKLLALSGSPNAHEAAAAAQRAQALVSRHRLEAWLAATEALDGDPITDGRDAPLEVGRRLRKWKVALAATLADTNGCVAWIEGRGREEAVCVVGRDRDREVVRELYDGLVRRLEWLSATAGPGRDRAWHEAFRVGAAEAIGERLRAGTDEARDEVATEALVRVDASAAAHRDALERFVDERLGRGKGRSMRVDARAFERGRAAGATMPLPA